MGRCLQLIACLSTLLALSPLGQASPRTLSDDQVNGRKRLSVRQSSGRVETSRFYRRGYPATIVVDNWLYIDGGEFSYLDGRTVKFEHATATLAIDLSQSWTNSSVTIKETPHADGVPNLIATNLWYNKAENELLQGFVGAASPWPNSNGPQDLSLWSFKLDGQGGGTWSQVYDSGAGAFASLTRPFQSSMAQDDEAAYILGGLSTGDTSPETVGQPSMPLPGLITYNFTTREFVNSSASPYHGDGTAVRGQMVYVPIYGEKGIFLPLGGDAPDREGYTPGERKVGFNNLTIYDPATQRWYSQKTTGAAPKGRIEFCAVGTNSTNGTFEIVVYGGWGSNLGEVAVAWDEIFVLTLPAFHWFKHRYTPQRPRHGHSCQVVGNRQMLIVGGVDTTQDTIIPFPDEAVQSVDISPFNTRDPFAQGLGIFDMSTLSFSNRYDAQAPPYEQSDIVADYYRQNPRYPQNWDNEELQTVMRAVSDSPPDPTSSPSLPELSGSFNTTNPSAAPTIPPSEPMGGGTIAGIALGSVGGVALIGLGGFFLLRRRRQRRQQRQLEQEASEKDHHLHSPDASSGGASDGYGGVYSEMLADHDSSKLGPVRGELDSGDEHRPMMAMQGQGLHGQGLHELNSGGQRERLHELNSDGQRHELDHHQSRNKRLPPDPVIPPVEIG